MADFDFFGQVADWAKGTSDTILGTWLQGRQTRKNMELAQQYNMANYERENADKIAQWQRENAYNDPRAQMERYARAGLNPNLIYGQANESANSPALASMGMYQPPAAPLAVGASMLETEQARANIDLTKAQEVATLRTAGLTEEQTRGVKFANDLNDLLANYEEYRTIESQTDGKQVGPPSHDVVVVNKFVEKFNKELKQVDMANDMSYTQTLATAFSFFSQVGLDGTRWLLDMPDAPQVLGALHINASDAIETASTAVNADRESRTIARDMAKLAYEITQSTDGTRSDFYASLKKKADAGDQLSKVLLTILILSRESGLVKLLMP